MMWIQCLITGLGQFLKSICTTKQSDGKRIYCALIRDYYNPMNKHLSCQHLQYELLPRDCDPIWISLSYVLFIKCEKVAHMAYCWPEDVRQIPFNHNILGLNPAEDHFYMSSLFSVLSSSTSHCSVKAKMPEN